MLLLPLDKYFFTFIDIHSALCRLSTQAHTIQRIPYIILHFIRFCRDFKNACRFFSVKV